MVDTGTSARHSGHVFICYATEDTKRVAALERVLTTNRIPLWRFTTSLKPGDDWEAETRSAIKNGCIAFLACFSTASVARESSYQRTELLLAIDEVRSRQPGSRWLIPVRLDDCEIPAIDIGGGRTLASIQRADLFGPQLEQNRDRLVAEIKEISRRSPEPEAAQDSAEPGKPQRPGWVTAYDVFERTYQEWVGWAGTMISPVAMSSVLHLGTDPEVAAVYLARVPAWKAARMLAASPPAMAGKVLKRMQEKQEKRATAILNCIPASIAQAIVDTM